MGLEPQFRLHPFQPKSTGMSGLITHQLLDQYESVSGELEKLPPEDRPDGALWDLLDELMLDLHLINHGYAKDGYVKHLDRRLLEVCSDKGVADRMRAIRF